MTNKYRLVGLAISLLAAPASAAEYAIEGVSVVPMDREVVLEDQTVVIRDGIITHVGPRRSTRIGKQVRRIDGRGRFLAPGLADMHSHARSADDLIVNLAAGVTLLRVMWGEPVVLSLREKVRKGAIAGPDIVTSGRIVDGLPPIHYATDAVVDAESARRSVRRYKDEGYDFIKVYSNLSVPAFDALAAAAKAEGIPFAGHVPYAVPLEHALRSGMLSNEHLFGFAPAIAVDGEGDVMAFRSTKPDTVGIVAKIGRGEIDPASLFDDRKAIAVAQLARSEGIWTVPTLSVLEPATMTDGERQAVRDKPEMAVIPPGIKSFWRAAAIFDTDRSPEVIAGRKRLFAMQGHWVKLLDDSGAGILAGIDASNPYVIIGFGLVHELELFQHAGLTPYRALRTATVNPAAYLGRSGKLGVIRPGAAADLLLLDANPLQDVSNLRLISGVMRGGRWHPKSELQQKLSTIARRYRQWDAAIASAPPLTEDGRKPDFIAAYAMGEADGSNFERVATYGKGEMVVQTVTPSATVQQRVLRSASGQLLSFDKRVGERASSIVQAGKSYTYRSGNGPVSPIALDPAARPVTGTSADAIILNDLLVSLNVGQSRTIPIVEFDEIGKPRAASWTITRLPDRMGESELYFAGMMAFEVKEAGRSAPIAIMEVNGGFFKGQLSKLSFSNTEGKHRQRIE